MTEVEPAAIVPTVTVAVSCPSDRDWSWAAENVAFHVWALARPVMVAGAVTAGVVAFVSLSTTLNEVALIDEPLMRSGVALVAMLTVGRLAATPEMVTML